MKSMKLFTMLCAATAMTYGTATTTYADTMVEELTTPLNQMKDQSPVTLTGTIETISGDEFELNYGGPDDITVELDRFGWTGNETDYLVEGESVTVSGYIDDDLFEGREIEAYNIRMNDSYVYYYTTEVDPIYYYETTDTDYDSLVSIKGTIETIDGKDFTVKTTSGNLMKATAEQLDYDPFDDVGLQSLKTGDSVYVYGEMDKDFFETKELEAKGIVELVSSP